MNRRGALVFTAVLETIACGRGAAPPARPDVLLITLDTTRADRLGCYGYRDALTPRLDALAASGVRFDAAYASSPMTLPSHTTMLTGLPPPEHGVRINGRQRLGATIPTLATELRGAGYHTGAFVAAYVLARRFGLDRGFEVYDDDLTAARPQTVHERLSVYRGGDAVADAAVPWLDAAAQGPDPFFLWVHFYDPHYPDYANPQLDGTRYAGVASYDAEVAFMDQQVGRLLDVLDARGVAERTLVVAVADHGEGLGDHGEHEHGYLLNEEVLRVPLVIRWPRAQRAGHVVPAIVSLADLAPTVFALTGVAPPPGLKGRSIAPALLGEGVPSEVVYAETELPYWVFGWSPLYGLTTERWKYVRSSRPELHDRAADRAERTNLAPARPDIVQALAHDLEAVEAGFHPVAAPNAPVDATTREKLEALGYLDGGRVGAAPPSQGLRDIKDMLDTKQLASDITAGLATGRIDRATAIAMTRELVRRSPESSGFHQRLGTLLLEAGDQAGAIASLSESVRLRPDAPEAQIALAQALTRAGRLEDALPHFRSAIAIDPELAEAHLGLGSGLAALGQLDEALTVLENAARLLPASADVQVNLGNVRLRRGDEHGAEAAYREALRLDPDNALAHYNLATLLARGDDVEVAVTHAREATRVAPNLATAQDMLGRLLVEIGDVQGGVAALERATTLDPSVPEFSDDLAAAYAAAGRFGLAAMTARKGVRKAEVLGRQRLASEMRQRVAYYRAQAARSPRPGLKEPAPTPPS